MDVRIVTGPEAEQTRELLRLFRENLEVLDREWPMLVRDHLHEWVAVYGGGTLVVKATSEDIDAAVPPAERGTAVIRYIINDELALGS